MASRRSQASARSVLSAPLARRCDEDRQPCPAPQRPPAGPDEALLSGGVPLPVPIHHQLPAAAAPPLAAEATAPAAVQQHAVARRSVQTDKWPLLFDYIIGR